MFGFSVIIDTSIIVPLDYSYGMTRKGLENELIRTKRLKSAKIIKAFSSVDRAIFLPKHDLPFAYEDVALPIGFGQTGSQPSTVVFMLELLAPEIGDRILDIGSGSGWTTALLSKIVGRGGQVFGVERIPELIEFGQNNLLKVGATNATIYPSNKNLGLIKYAPYDKILVSAMAKTFPLDILQQLKIGGRIVIPIGNSIFKIDKVDEGKILKKSYPGFVFVDLKVN